MCGLVCGRQLWDTIRPMHTAPPCCRTHLKLDLDGRQPALRLLLCCN